jgi:DHA2 family multidrug resistance protein
MLQKHMDIPPLTVGLLMAPRGFASMAGSILAGVMLAWLQPRYVLIVACLLLAWATWRMTDFTPDTSEAHIMGIIAGQGFTMGLVTVCVSTATFTTLSPEQRADGTSFYNLVRKLGSSVGVSFLVSQLVRNSQSYRSNIVENVSPFEERFDLSVKPESWHFDAIEGIARIEREVLRQAEFLAYLQDFWWLTIVTLAMVPMALLLRTTKADTGK